MDAKQYENIGKRIHIQNTPEIIELLKDDTLRNIEHALDKDGHTGFLGEKDGIVRGKPQVYKGFFIQCYGQVRYASDLDVFGRLYWYGWAKKETELKGQKVKIEFGVNDQFPLGLDSEHEAGHWLTKMVDAYQKQNNK